MQGHWSLRWSLEKGIATRKHSGEEPYYIKKKNNYCHMIICYDDGSAPPKEKSPNVPLNNILPIGFDYGVPRQSNQNKFPIFNLSGHE